MKPGHIIPKPLVMLLAVGFLLAFTASLMAQVESSTSTTAGTSSKEVTIKRGQVEYVSGNNLIVKDLDTGEIRHITVPPGATATVDGKTIGINDVKVGMTLEKKVTTTTTPKMITKVETVTGKVFQVMPPRSVILTLDNNQNQRFNIPEGQKFNVDGQMVDAFGLRKGMMISATRVTEVPETVVTQKAVVSGQMPPPPPPPPDQPILIVVMAPTPAPAPEAPAPEAAPAALPKTASSLPLIGLLGALMFALGLGLRAARVTR